MFIPATTDPELQPLWAHPSQHPSRWVDGLVDGLRRGAVPHKYHYDTPKQVDRWLRLHEDYSPAHRLPSVQKIYCDSINESLETTPIASNTPQFIAGIGCGGGWKDQIVIRKLVESGSAPFYLAVDVGAAMTWTAIDQVRPSLPEPDSVAGLSIDLETITDWADPLNAWRREGQREGFTFFGMIPNWEPARALSGLAQTMLPGDMAWISFNLAPGNDPQLGTEQVLNQYKNPQTEKWICTVLEDIGFPIQSGIVDWNIHTVSDVPVDARKIQADFRFTQSVTWEGLGEKWNWSVDDTIRLFFSCRYTLEQARSMIQNAQPDWQILNEKVAENGEEAVFAIRFNQS